MSKKILSIITFSILSVLFASTAFASASDDRAISKSIRKSIDQELRQSFATHNVSILTKGGVVYLRGHVSSFQEAQIARGIAANTQGVNKVVNQIDINSGN